MTRALTRAVFSFCVLVSAAAAWQSPAFENGLRLKREQKLAEAADVFRRILDTDPANVDVLVQLATVEGWQKHYDESVALWTKAWSLRPDDSDIGMGLARVLYWKGENEKATEAMRRILKGTPRYVDALVLMGDIQMASGRTNDAKGYYEQAHQIEPATAGLAGKLVNAAAPLRFRLDVGFAADDYTNFRGLERTAFAQLSYRVHPRATLWVRQDHLDHFSQVDNAVGFGGAVQVTRPLVLTAELNFTPHREFEPASKVLLSGDYLIHPRLTLMGAYRRWNYPAGAVNMYAPGFRWQVLSRLGAVVKYNFSRNLDRSVTHAVQSQLEFQVQEKLQLYTGFARGAENIPPQALASFRSYYGGAVWNASRRLGLRLDYAFEARPGFYDRHSIGPGIRLSF